MIDLLYPVGAIYMSMNDVNPSTLFGGTWEQIQDRFLLCSSSSKQTGGSTTISTSNLPSHKHTFSATVNASGDHTHTFSGTALNAGMHTHTFSGKAITGNMSVDGGTGIVGGAADQLSGCFSRGSQKSWVVANGNSTGYSLNFNATPSGTISQSTNHSHNVSGTISESGGHIHSVDGTTDNTGEGTAYWQPYMTCYCWHRTA